MTDTAHPTEADAVAALTAAAAQPQLLDIDAADHAAVFVPQSGRVDWHDGRRHASTPPRKRGCTHLRDPESFAAYVNAHSGSSTTVYGDLPTDGTRPRIIAVLNDHTPENDSAGWGDYTAVWALEHSPQWKAWTGHAGSWMTQSSFADHLEQHAADIVEPAAAEFLEVAQSLQVHTSVAFKAARRLHDGQTQLQYEETTESKAGERGQLAVPTTFTIGVPVFVGLDPYKIEARFRFRTNQGELKVQYRLQRADDIVSAAFDDAWSSATSQLTVAALEVLGKPAQERLS